MFASESPSSNGDPGGRIWTVTELNRTVKELLEQTLMPFWLRGEIGNLTIHRSGHVYLTLKDERSQVRGVFFRGADSARQLELCTGKEVEVWGRMGVYEPRGEYQVIINSVRPIGLGDLQRRFEELRERLRSEGLFDDDRKRPIPVLPRCVGVVTSPEGAAIRDFLRILERRFGDMHVRIVPVAVQGDMAARQIAAAIRFLNSEHACDVIVVTRGGGSIEDLWSFNEEVVARAISVSEIPVISAVGHERDFSIADFAADLRVATPSAAAEQVIAGKAELREQIDNWRRRIVHSLGFNVMHTRRRLEHASRSPLFQEPMNLVRLYGQKLDDLSLRMCRGLSGHTDRLRATHERLTTQLRLLNPKNILERGYAILTDVETGAVIRRVADTSRGKCVNGILATGRLTLTVTETEAQCKAQDRIKRRTGHNGDTRLEV